MKKKNVPKVVAKKNLQSNKDAFYDFNMIKLFD